MSCRGYILCRAYSFGSVFCRSCNFGKQLNFSTTYVYILLIFIGGIFDTALMPVGDAMSGMAGGAIAKSVNNSMQLQQAAELYNRADATLQAAEANAQSMTSAQYIQQNNLAQDLFNQARRIETRVNGKFMLKYLEKEIPIRLS